MKMKRKQILSFLLILLLLMSTNIEILASTISVIKVTKISLDKTKDTIGVGNIDTLKATITPKNATNQNITWSSSDKTIADVDNNGVVTGYKVGTTTIKVATEDGKKYAICKVTINIPVTKVTLSRNEYTLVAKDKYILDASIIPFDATNKKIIWKSSNTKIATVKDGIVTAIKDGIVTISAISVDGNIEDKCVFTIIPNVPASSIKLDKNSESLIVGTKKTLTAKIYPENTTTKIKWTSSNSSVVKVDNGEISAVKKGSAKIIATTIDGNKTATCNITVGAVVPVTSVKLNKTNDIIGAGLTDTLKAIINPDNASNQDVVWSSSDNTIATVSDEGIVTGIKEGNVIITATTVDGNHIATCNVTIDKVITFADPYLDNAVRNELTAKTMKLYDKINVPYLYSNDVKILTELHAWNNNISDLDGIENLTNLLNLDLGLNHVTNFEPLTKLKLHVLDLNNNNITDISKLGELKDLQGLILFNNHISDVSSLHELTNLRNLILRGNPISSESYDSLKEALPNCDINL